MRRGPAAWLLGCLAVAAACGARHESAGPPPPPAPAANPAQAEMRLLVAAMETAVRGVAYADVREVAPALARVDEAKERTEAALGAGTYRPPRNREHLDHFVELDEAFHHDLERLAAASRANDVQGTADAAGAALRSCNGCHSEFR